MTQTKIEIAKVFALFWVTKQGNTVVKRGSSVTREYSSKERVKYVKQENTVVKRGSSVTREYSSKERV